MRHHLLAPVSFALALVPMVALAAGAPRNLGDLAAMLAGLLNTGTAVLVLIAIVIFFWGVVASLWKQNQGNAKAGAWKIIMWGVIAIFVMVSIWGIIGLLQETIFGERTQAAPAQQSGQRATPDFTAPPPTISI